MTMVRASFVLMTARDTAILRSLSTHDEGGGSGLPRLTAELFLWVEWERTTSKNLKSSSIAMMAAIALLGGYRARPWPRCASRGSHAVRDSRTTKIGHSDFGPDGSAFAMRCPRCRAFPHCRTPRLDPVTAARRQRRVLATATRGALFDPHVLPFDVEF